VSSDLFWLLYFGNGIIGLAIGDLPKPIAGLCNRQLILNDLTVQAVIDG